MTTGTTTQQPIRSTMAPTDTLFHGGFVTLLTGLVWHFFSWPAPSPTWLWVGLGLCAVGSVTAGLAWIAGLSLSRTNKLMVTGAFLALIGVIASSIAADLELMGHVLQPWRQHENVLIHEGLHIQCPLPAGWQVALSQPFLANKRRHGDHEFRLLHGETAGLLFLEGPVDQGQLEPSRISIWCSKSFFQTLGDTLRLLSNARLQYESQATQATILRETSVRHGRGIDIVDCELVNRQGHHVVLASIRCDWLLLFVEMTTVRENDRRAAAHFLESLQIIGRNACLTN